MSAEITLFVNPAAGRGRGVHAAQPAASALRDAGFHVRTVVGTDAEDALARLRTAVREGTGAVAAVGGDGVVSLALRAPAGTLVPLGVVAVGTGNDFALALPVREPARAGLFPYRITLDDGPPIETEATLVAVLGSPRTESGGGSSYGGGMRICADAVPDDGLFDVVVGDGGRATLLKVFPQVYRGTHLGHAEVTVHRAAKVTLEAAGLTAYADGERVGPLPVTAECVPAAVRILGRRRPESGSDRP
ncbi:sphingosine kinase [Streptomyces sp. BR123]|uniref:diacylglycerol kinase family protein n=1 Tax=Streptomyces sp. BR123 TaxID=2749828 RepID=UPI0015C40FAF|nr:diacylglycerol kinase family protein [Streptomyces sp. BR123]NXY97275.1 sphingosine kinase [Streptomyces sp. BR123]